MPETQVVARLREQGSEASKEFQREPDGVVSSLGSSLKQFRGAALERIGALHRASRGENPSAVGDGPTPGTRSDLSKSGVQSQADQIQKREPTFSEKLVADLGRDFGVKGLQYVRHHQPTDGKTLEGHFLKVEGREYFWDPKGGRLQVWSATQKRWDVVLPKRDEGSGERLAARTGADAVAQGTVAKLLEGQTSISESLQAANDLGRELKEYGAAMEVLSPEKRAVLSRKERLLDAIAAICEREDARNHPFIKRTGVDPARFLSAYKEFNDARNSDAVAREKYKGSPDVGGLVSFHRRHMADDILDNYLGRQVSRLADKTDVPDALANLMRFKGLAI